MKIHDMTTKKALEVELTDLLVIEDAEDTKAITVAEFLECLGIHRDREVKELINLTLDRVIKGLKRAKYKFDYDKFFVLNIWIGSDSGNIQFSVMDAKTRKWLTREELVRLLGPIDKENYEQEYQDRIEYIAADNVIDEDSDEEPKRTYVVKLFIDDIRHDCVSYQIRDFKEDHSEGTNAWLEADNAGYIKAYFDGLTHNQIASITRENVSVTMDEYTDENRIVYHYHFLTEEESFINSVVWIGEIIPPFGDADYPHDPDVDEDDDSGFITPEPEPNPEPVPTPTPEEPEPTPNPGDSEEDGDEDTGTGDEDTDDGFDDEDDDEEVT